MNNKRIDEVNDNLTITQSTTGLTFGTDALLLAAYISRNQKAKALELGSGTGIISLLLSTRNKVSCIDALEIQEQFYLLTEQNILNNSQQNKVKAILGDVRTFSSTTKNTYDIVFSNPPYMKNNIPECKYSEKQIARHEVYGTIEDFVGCASKVLKYGGKFYCVYRPDRLNELMICCQNNNLMPKRLTLVQARADTPPSIVLLEAKKGGNLGLKVTKTLIIGSNLDERNDSPDMTYILNEGSFPKEYE